MTKRISTKWVKTRAEHICSGCGRKFPKGVRLYCCTASEGANIFSYYTCDTCLEYMSRYYEPDDMYGDGEIRSGDPEAWEELRREVEGIDQ